MISSARISRRNLLKSIAAGTITLGVFSLQGCDSKRSTGNKARRPAPDAIVSIASDGVVSITVTRSEMGQGVRTSLPMIVADELECDWSRIHVRQAQGHPKYGDQNTDGSASIRKFYEPMRHAGAAIREMLIAAAAARWQVDANACTALNHEIQHLPSGRSLGYGELAEAAAQQDLPENPALKQPTDFRYIGRSRKSVDAENVVQGKARYGADLSLPDMLYASINRCPVVGGDVVSFSDENTRAMPGVRQIMKVDRANGAPGFGPLGGVAVIADNSWAALQGRAALKVEWNFGPNADFDSDEAASELRKAARAPGTTVLDVGDVDTAFEAPGRVVEALYETPLLAHASMEPPVCTATVSADGCTVWAPVQSPQRTRSEIARLLGIDADNIEVNVTLLGGAFGRKAKPDFVLEAVLLSRAMQAPVQLIWSREDDIRHDYYHANSAQYFKALLDDTGIPTAWLQRSVFPPIQSTFDDQAEFASESELRLGFVDNPYPVANMRCENGAARTAVRIGWLRSVCNIFHAFSTNAFVDELAAASDADPLAYRRSLIEQPSSLAKRETAAESKFPFDANRFRSVLDAVAEDANWGKSLPANSGQGIAVHRSFYTYVAQVVEVSVDAQGQIAVHSVHCAMDCGQVVNPDTVNAQIEGAVMFALGFALSGSITLANGRVSERNFHDYSVLRMDAAPRVHVRIMDSDAAPTGVGEPGVPPLAPALCGAIFAATGIRLRKLPVAEQLRRAIAERQPQS